MPAAFKSERIVNPGRIVRSRDPDRSVGRFSFPGISSGLRKFPLLPVGIGGVAFHEERMKGRGGSLHLPVIQLSFNGHSKVIR